MNPHYTEWKTEHIAKAAAKRSFIVGAPIRFVRGQIDNPGYPPGTGSNDYIEGFCEIVPSPEFDCRILDFRSTSRLLGAFQDCAYDMGDDFQTNGASVSIFLGNDEIVRNAPCFPLINQITNFSDPSFGKGDVTPSIDPYYFSTYYGGTLVGCELSDSETWKKNPLYVKAGEKLRFNFDLRYLGPAVNWGLPAKYVTELAVPAVLYSIIETVV